jgi:D-3-phosphoglycerate dehydrogenase
VIKVVVSDPMAKEGLDLLRNSGLFDVVTVDGADPAALAAALTDASALLVRSGTKVTAGVMAAAPGLKLVGRAGTGVDNVDVEAATRHGIVVMNTPDANSIAAAELTWTLLLAMVRNLVPAAASLAAGRWERSGLMGTELAGKSLGVVGFGRIGREVAARARAFDMTVLVADPFVTEEIARAAGARLVTLDELLAASDIVTLHLPLTKGTRHLIGAPQMAAMKPGARLVNCARGGLVDEAALKEALDGGHLAGAALDVFEQEPPPADHPLRSHPKVVAAPHLGASTKEAQENVSSELARQVLDYFGSGAIRNAVNMPGLSAEAYAKARPYLDLAERLGLLAGGLAGPGAWRRLSIEYFGDAADQPLQALTLAALKGVLSTRAGEAVNFVNARLKAQELDLEIAESFDPDPDDRQNRVRVVLEGGDARASVDGHVARQCEPRLVAIDGFELEAIPVGPLVIIRNDDVPGVVGAIGTALGDAGLNIARISWGRDTAGGAALTVIGLDEPATAEVLAGLAADRRVRHVTGLVLPPPGGG